MLIYCNEILLEKQQTCLLGSLAIPVLPRNSHISIHIKLYY